jgi:hypothetical protein
MTTPPTRRVNATGSILFCVRFAHGVGIFDRFARLTVVSAHQVGTHDQFTLEVVELTRLVGGSGFQ